MINGLASFGQGFLKGMNDAEDRKHKRMEFEAKQKAEIAERERSEFNKRLDARKSGFLVPRSGEDFDPGALEYDPQYLKMKEREAAAMGGKMLPADTVLKVEEGASIPALLDDIDITLAQNAESFGPVAGRAASWNPYDTKAQTIDAQMRVASQAFGRKMEGGVLRKEDEEKYRRMFPQLSDTPDVAKNKLAIVRRMLVEKQNSEIRALGAQGYRTKGFKPMPSAPPASGLLKGGDQESKDKARLEELRRKAAGG